MSCKFLSSGSRVVALAFCSDPRFEAEMKVRQRMPRIIRRRISLRSDKILRCMASLLASIWCEAAFPYLRVGVTAYSSTTSAPARSRSQPSIWTCSAMPARISSAGSGVCRARWPVCPAGNRRLFTLLLRVPCRLRMANKTKEGGCSHRDDLAQGRIGDPRHMLRPCTSPAQGLRGKIRQLDA